jgi:acyl carrier protein
MNQIDRDYESKMLKMAIDKYLDETISGTEEDLRTLKDNRDRIVWDLTTRIYSEIGQTVELSTVRDIVNSRIEAINHQLAEEQKYIAEETYRVTEQKSIDEVDCRDTQEDADFHSKVTAVLGKFGGDESKAKVFVRVRNIISDKLAVDESKINLDCHMSNHLNMDDLDLVEIVMALEEEFDIQISDECDNLCFSIGSFDWFSGSGSGSSYSSFKAGEECIVRNFVELVYKKISLSQ